MAHGKHRRSLRGIATHLGKQKNHSHQWFTERKLNGELFEFCQYPKCRALHRKIDNA